MGAASYRRKLGRCLSFSPLPPPNTVTTFCVNTHRR